MQMPQITRREILRGAGSVVIGLPFLESLNPLSAQEGKSAKKYPVRMAALYMPNGANRRRGRSLERAAGRSFSSRRPLSPSRS